MARQYATTQTTAARLQRPRVIATTGLVVSAFLLLIAYLDRSSHQMAIFGGLTVVFLLALRTRMRSRG